jgi:hypothetical protein
MSKLVLCFSRDSVSLKLKTEAKRSYSSSVRIVWAPFLTHLTSRRTVPLTYQSLKMCWPIRNNVRAGLPVMRGFDNPIQGKTFFWFLFIYYVTPEHWNFTFTQITHYTYIKQFFSGLTSLGKWEDSASSIYAVKPEINKRVSVCLVCFT